MANLFNNRFLTDSYNPMYPGLNKSNYDKVIAYGNSLGLEDEEEKRRAENNYYRNNVNKMVNDQILNERDEVINQQSYQAATLNSEGANEELRKTELSQALKRKYNLDAKANDKDLFNDFASGLNDEGKKLLAEYVAGKSNEFLYVAGLAERPQEVKKEETKETGLQKAGDFVTGVAQSPGKRGYNIIGQWMDRLGNWASEQLEGTAVDRWVNEKAVELFGEDAVREYEQTKQQRIQSGDMYKGSEQTDIKTPILGQERANNGWTKAGEVVGDIATGIAVTAPLAAATAPMYAGSTIGGAATLGGLEGALDSAVVKYGTTGDAPSLGDLTLGGIFGAAGGLFSRYMQSLPKTKNESIRKEAEEYINKSIKPTVKGKMSQSDYNKYIDDTLDVANFMDKNKDILKYTDDAGDTITGKLPTNMRETSETLGNLKKTLYDMYNGIAKQAGEKGARVDMNKAFSQLDDLNRDVSQNIANPQTRNIIENYKRALLEYTDDAGTIAIEDAQKLTQDFNKQLTAFFKNPNMNDVSKNSIIAQLNRWTKDAINDSLDDALDNGITKGGSMAKYYKDLKGMYGKIKTIEDEVSKRAIVEARKNTKGLSQTVIDSLAGGEFTDAILSANVGKLGKAAIMKTIGRYYKYINDPNVQLNNLFRLVQESNNPGVTQGVISKGINAAVDTISEPVKQVGKNIGKKLIKPNVLSTVGEVLTND